MKVVGASKEAGKWSVTLELMGEEKLWASTLVVLLIGFNWFAIQNTDKHYFPC